jgi:ribonucleotide monophosphatase NagD (HAD superfamily)
MNKHLKTTIIPTVTKKHLIKTDIPTQSYIDEKKPNKTCLEFSNPLK